MDDEVEFPTDSFDLISHLDATFPEKCIGPKQSLEDAHRYAGKRELVAELIRWAKESNPEYEPSGPARRKRGRKVSR